ncbi:hypothetical protein BpHYR1_037543 [Brachionus plicatilis]|uniref:Uncharacterized protein n=1 Tax=Brachionus plicatilis TaxID=10195 RepID=A0A3M7S008_BRAPC|nr:hypothetical protein BpHYR1_037543 [Brachionus plicatilis]
MQIYYACFYLKIKEYDDDESDEKIIQSSEDLELIARLNLFVYYKKSDPAVTAPNLIQIDSSSFDLSKKLSKFTNS